LLAARRRRGTPVKGADLLLQAVPGLRWCRDRITADALARDHGISQATVGAAIVVLCYRGNALDVLQGLGFGAAPAGRCGAGTGERQRGTA